MYSYELTYLTTWKGKNSRLHTTDVVDAFRKLQSCSSRPIFLKSKMRLQHVFLVLGEQSVSFMLYACDASGKSLDKMRLRKKKKLLHLTLKNKIENTSLGGEKGRSGAWSQKLCFSPFLSGCIPRSFGPALRFTFVHNGLG